MDPARLATDLVLTADDLGPGWHASPGAEREPADHEDAGADLVEACLGPSFPAGDVQTTASSALFQREPNAFAYATALVFRHDAAAAAALAGIASEDFAACFAEAVAADLLIDPEVREFLGVTCRRVGDRSGAIVHRASFSAADPEGVQAVTVDLAVLAGGPAVVLVWLGDAPEPIPDDERSRMTRRLRGRLAA